MSDRLATETFGRGERAEGGRFTRQDSKFRDWVTADGSSAFAAEAGRYRLYVSWACPWAHRTIILRELKGLQDAIGMSVVDPIRDEEGWAFLSEAYAATDPAFDGRITVPVLWDTETDRIVNNESADILVMLNEAFDAFAEHPERDYYPAELRPVIDPLNQRVYET